MTEQKHRTVQVIIIEKWDFFLFCCCWRGCVLFYFSFGGMNGFFRFVCQIYTRQIFAPKVHRWSVQSTENNVTPNEVYRKKASNFDIFIFRFRCHICHIGRSPILAALSSVFPSHCYFATLLFDGSLALCYFFISFTDWHKFREPNVQIAFRYTQHIEQLNLLRTAKITHAKQTNYILSARDIEKNTLECCWCYGGGSNKKRYFHM